MELVTHKKTLIERLISFDQKAETFLKQFSTISIDLCLNGYLSAIDMVQDLLIGKWDKKKQKLNECNVTLFFDLSDYAKFQCRVAHPDMKKFINDRLLMNIGEEEPDGICALEGKRAKLIKKFPNPNLPIIGPTYLMSMNIDAPCQYRYGLISNRIFPTGKKVVRDLQNALLYITDREREGKTWRSIPNHKREKKREKKDLLIVYLEEKPDNSIELASIFSDSAEEDIAENIFEERAAAVCSALDGERGITDSSLIRLFVITKVDKGRAQIVLSDVFTVRNMHLSVDNWRIAAQNLPSISVLLPGKKDEKAIIAKPGCPAPASVMRCLQQQWIRNGSGKSAVPGCRLREVYDIFLNDQQRTVLTAKRLLSLTLKRSTPLLLGVGGAISLGDWKSLSKEARKTALTFISLIAILLYKLGIKKEVYMNKYAFNIGRLLALADTLHKEYCLHVRKGQTPSQLIGNALMTTAVDNPERCLARLLERLRIYQAWANKAHGDEFRLAKWVLGQMGEVSSALAKNTVPHHTDDADRAQMLLGYLARYKKED